MVKEGLTPDSAARRTPPLNRKGERGSIMDTLRLDLDQARRFLADRSQPLTCTLTAIADRHRRRCRTDDEMAALGIRPMFDLRQHPWVACAILAYTGRRRTTAHCA